MKSIPAEASQCKAKSKYIFRSLKKKKKKKSKVWRYNAYLVEATGSLVFYFSRDEGSYALFLNFSEASSFASSPTFSLLAYLLSSIARAGKTTFASSF